MQIHCIGYFNFTKNAKKGTFFYYYLAVRNIFSNFALSIIVLFLQKIDFYLQKLILLSWIHICLIVIMIFTYSEISLAFYDQTKAIL